MIQTTNYPSIEQVTVTPTVAIDHGRNANDISKFNLPDIDNAAAAAAAAAAVDMDSDTSSDAPFVLPLKIILPVEHVHKSKANNSYVRYNYILLKVDDTAYHEHFPNDNTEILFPLADNVPTESPMEWSTSEPASDNSHETTIAATITAEKATSTANIFDTYRNEQTNENAAQNDIVLVDSQGYRYELTQHIKIVDELETHVIEFDSIAMVRERDDTKANSKQATKRILSDDIEPQQQIDNEKNDINVSQYERHYANIFQWLHYHLWAPNSGAAA